MYSSFIDLCISKYPDYKYIFAKPQGIDENLFAPYLKDERIQLSDNSIDLMQRSRAGIVKTGTSNLEAALCGMPFVMMYKASPLTFMIGKSLVNLDYISLVNILLDKPLVKELIQGDANPVTMADEISRLIENSDDSLINDYSKIRELLGEPGSSDRIANEIMSNYMK